MSSLEFSRTDDSNVEFSNLTKSDVLDSESELADDSESLESELADDSDSLESDSLEYDSESSANSDSEYSEFESLDSLSFKIPKLSFKIPKLSFKLVSFGILAGFMLYIIFGHNS